MSTEEAPRDLVIAFDSRVAGAIIENAQQSGLTPSELIVQIGTKYETYRQMLVAVLKIREKTKAGYEAGDVQEFWRSVERELAE